jgi:CRISPR-associated protein Cas2
MFYAICYDVTDDRRRQEVAKVLKDFGCRVQLSVFEANLDPQELERLKTRVHRLLDPQEDTLRIYPLCAACSERVLVLGRGQITRDPDVIVL